MKCENCSKEHDGSYGSGRFCSSKCARGFSTKEKRDEINRKVSAKVTGRKQSKERRLKTSGKNHPNWKGGYSVLEERVCLECGSFYKRPSKNFCSKECWIKNNKKIRTEWQQYQKECAFKFNIYDYPDWFDLSLIEKFGWYSAANRGNNLEGVSRDHMISVKYGFRNGISSELISHPANCQLMQHTLNNTKKTQCSITLNELEERIKKFNVRLAE